MGNYRKLDYQVRVGAGARKELIPGGSSLCTDSTWPGNSLEQAAVNRGAQEASWAWALL